MKVVIRCDHCGAPLSYKAGDYVATCKYCGYTTVLTHDRPFTLEHSLLPFNVKDGREAVEIVKGWMASSFLAPKGLDRKAKFDEVVLFVYPFWVVPIEAVTRFKGVFERIGAGHVKEGKVRGKYDWLVVAQRASDFPTREYDVPLRGKMPYDFTKIPEYAKVLNAEFGEEEAVEKAKAEVVEHHIYLARKEVDRVIEHETEFKVGEACYLHAPVWRINYSYKGKRYRVLVDGTEGKVIVGDLPTPGIFDAF
ncbi:MAG: hypothetical protein QXN15_11210 [Candidatus Jordarchaeales archaeon]|nr:hypothetical protein [Candidatus Jordarchaeia archaeon]